MARTVDQNIVLMDDEQATHTELVTLNSPSQTADYTLWKGVVATVQVTQENLLDALTDEINTEINSTFTGTPAWIQGQVFKFQYSATLPQILQLINFAPSYAVVDETLRVVTQCSVQTDLNKVVNIKVNKGVVGFLTALDVLEYGSLQGYLNSIMFAGVGFNLVNLDPDMCMIEGDVYYDGQYTSTIQSAMESAIATFMASIPYDGVLYVSEIEKAMKAVTGVKDVKLERVIAHLDSVPIGSATDLFNLSTGYNGRVYNFGAGAIVPETTATWTLSDRITYKVS